MTTPNDQVGYQDYTDNVGGSDDYLDYNAKYRKDARKSDVRIVDIIGTIFSPDDSFRVLDIPCGIGNTLYHIHQAFPRAELFGSDLADTAIERCRKDPDMAGMTFEACDLVTGDPAKVFGQDFDVVTINALAFALENDEWAAALKNAGALLKQGGLLVNFDSYQSDQWELVIRRRITANDSVLPHHFHNKDRVEESLKAAAFTNINFDPFDVGIDIPIDPKEPGRISHTKRLDDGTRLSFMGSVFQPWHMLTARKA